MRINDLSPGISLLEVPGEGYEVTYRGRRLTAPSQPRLAAEKRAARFSILPKSIVFLPSPLLFYGVSTLLRGLPEDCLILFGEGNGELRRLSEQAFPREIRQDPRVHPGILGSMEELVQFLEVSPLQNFRRIQTISLTGGYALEARTYRGWEDAIRDAHEAILEKPSRPVLSWGGSGLKTSLPTYPSSSGAKIWGILLRISPSLSPGRGNPWSTPCLF